MDLENILGKIAMHILVNGNRTILMDTENFFSVTNIMKENLNKVKEKELDLTFIVMNMYIKVSGVKIKGTAQVN